MDGEAACWLGTEAYPMVQVKILSMLPFRDLLLNVAPTCSVLNGLVRDPDVWQVKHREHFGWASMLLIQETQERCRTLEEFRQLYTVQRRALCGDLIEMEGTFTGHREQEGFIYHLRLTVEVGRKGTRRWRGHPEDGPFWYDLLRALPDSEMAALEAHEAGDRRPNFGPSPREVLRVRTPEEASDGDTNPGAEGRLPPARETPVAGHIQWFLGAESDAESLAAYAEFYGDGEVDSVVGHLALEYVTGLYLPAERRLLLAGTHINNCGKGIIGCDFYDLYLSADGLRCRGRTRGHATPIDEMPWPHDFDSLATRLPGKDIPGVQFRDTFAAEHEAGP